MVNLNLIIMLVFPLVKLVKKLDVMDGSDFYKFIKEYHPAFTNLLGVDDPNIPGVNSSQDD